MKNLFSTLFAAAIISLSSCSEDVINPVPAIESVTSASNVITVTFTEAVFANNDASGDLTNSTFTVDIPDVTFTYSVSHTAGDIEAIITIVNTSIIPEGSEATITTATDIFDNESAVLAAGASGKTNIDADLGILGEWYSNGDNVAPLLVTFFKVDSVYAIFNADKTMYVEQFNIGNTSGTPDVIYNSTYTMVKSDVGNIWTIEIDQSVPYAAEVSGIFEIKTDPEVLWYEVVQTSGTQNIPPTPTTGFGSSNGGAFGDTNIQKFVRM